MDYMMMVDPLYWVNLYDGLWLTYIIWLYDGWTVNLYGLYDGLYDGVTINQWIKKNGHGDMMDEPMDELMGTIKYEH